ncbi:MAG TPA: SAM-dependent methyltransferase [Opitutaceae bacterium]|nr:SAM-dependent methyltransferase [Opitutaceae bacterium]
MSKPTADQSAPSDAFIARFRARASGDVARFDAFMDLALYDPEFGYYRRSGRRVGYGKGTDFFTATTSGPIFGELISAACASLLKGHDLRDFHFLEIGAEPGGGVLRDVAHPFASARTIRVGEPIEITGNAIVFSNELFDAQPFRRFVFRSGNWNERYVRLQHGHFVEELRPAENYAFAALPSSAPEGYQIDLPFASVELLRAIAAQPWRGLFLAFDYGKSWSELVEAQPAGTARAYFQHTQSNDLLARPGQQDLTCHVCWDWLTEVLASSGFSALALESQEAFFVHHASDFIGAAIAAEAARMSQRKLALMQLLHPAHLGQKFQALHATRMAPCANSD